MIREGGRIVKKRVLEKANFDARPSLETDPDPDLGIEHPSSPADADTPQATGDASMQRKANAVSRAVSVSAIFPCHVATGSHSTGQSLRVAVVLPMVPQRTPPPGRYSISKSALHQV